MNKQLIALSLIVLTTQASAELIHNKKPYSPEVRVGRYSTVAPGPTEPQKSLLDTVIHTRFHQRITTVGQAIDYLLLRSGYRLTNNDEPSVELMILSNYPLPEVHRDIGPITLSDALQTLAGPAFRMVVDPLSRLISFEIRSGYTEFLKDNPIYKSAIAKKRQRMEAYEAQVNQEMNQTEAQAHHDKPIQLPTKSMQVYGPVQLNESIFSIAKPFALKYQVSVTKMAYAMFLLNQEHFAITNNKPNINRLMKDVILEIPTYEEVAEVNEKEAWDVIRNG